MSMTYGPLSPEAEKIKKDLDNQLMKETAKRTIDNYLSVKELLEKDGRLTRREVISMAMEITKRKALFDW